jgi:hypothetical protein
VLNQQAQLDQREPQLGQADRSRDPTASFATFSGDLAGHATAAEALVQPWPHIDPEPELLDAALAQRQWR